MFVAFGCIVVVFAFVFEPLLIVINIATSLSTNLLTTSTLKHFHVPSYIYWNYAPEYQVLSSMAFWAWLRAISNCVKKLCKQNCMVQALGQSFFHIESSVWFEVLCEPLQHFLKGKIDVLTLLSPKYLDIYVHRAELLYVSQLMIFYLLLPMKLEGCPKIFKYSFPRYNIKVPISAYIIF